MKPPNLRLAGQVRQMRAGWLGLALLLVACEWPAGTQAAQGAPGQSPPAQSPPAQTQPQIPVQPQTPARTAPSPSPSRPAPNGTRDPHSGLTFIPAAQLPREGQQVLAQIAQGGPFRYSKDGSTFGNREGILPRQRQGYYREYTVKTPGEADRGARRIICGGQNVTSTAECYYTRDHYATFRRIRP